MSKTRQEWKVGVFVLIGLVVTALMVMRFSKGTGLSATYNLNLKARNASGIIRGASVLMAGVPIGSVSEIYLAPDGSSVTMVASIYDDFKISSNAVFGIGTVGFLGDRYVSVSPGRTNDLSVGFRQPGDTVFVEEAFDITKVAESANDLMGRLSGTVDQLSNAVTRLDRTLISEQSLSNLTATVENFRGLSERAMSAAGSLDEFMRTNTPVLSQSVTNFAEFTETLNVVTLELQQTVATNRAELTSAMKNIENATARADKILQDVEQGRGLAGAIFKNDEMARYTSIMLSNFMVFGSNVNTKGLWGVIRRPKIPKQDE